MVQNAPLLALDRLIAAEAKTRRERALAGVEESFAGDLARAFGKQRDAFLAAMKGGVDEALVERTGPGAYRVREASMPAWGEWESWWAQAEAAGLALLREAFRAALADAIAAGYKLGTADLALDYAFDLKNVRAIEWAAAHAEEAIEGINATSRDAVRRVIANAIETGASYTDTANAIRELTALSVERAEKIAVFEAAKAYEWANNDVAAELRDNGLEMEKAWLSAQDDKVDPEACAPNEDQGWIPLSEPFASGDDTAPAHMGCRCTTLYRRAGSEG